MVAETGEMLGREVVRGLGEGSWLCRERGGMVVVKRVGEGCLVQGELHPLIADRLGRVREIPVLAVANLLGVEKGREGGRESIYLVWEYLEGKTVGEGVEKGEVIRVARELVGVVGGMHARGLVHGGIKGGNVVVGGDGRVRVTHVSLLLNQGVEVDLRGVLEVLRGMGIELGGKSLREVEGGLIRMGRGLGVETEREVEEGRNWGSLAGAGAFLILGILVAVWFWRRGGVGW